MAEMQVKDLGSGGVNIDSPSMILPMNVFTDVLNVRFDDNAVQAITGETTGRVVTITPNYGIHWRRPDQGYNIFAKDGNIVRVDAAGSASSMMSSVSSDYTNSDWQGTTFNGGFAIVLNNGKSTPLYCLYNDPTAGTSFQPLPGWNYYSGITITAKVIRSLNYSLVAANLSITSGGITTFAPGTIRVSVQAATGQIPQVWAPGTTTDTADEFELSSTAQVLDMAELRGNMFVYSQDSISMLSIGATTKVVPYSKTYGILSTDCVVEFDGKHFVVDRNDIYYHNGSGNIESLVDFRTRKYFYRNLNQSYIDKVHVTRHAFYKEIWVCYPKGASTTCNEALIYNYKNNTWTKRALSNITYSFVGPNNVSNTFQYGKEIVYMTTATTQTLQTDDNYLMWDGSALVSYLSYVEKKRINTANLEATGLITTMYPVFDNVPTNADITIRVAGQNNYVEDIDLSIDGTGSHPKSTFHFKPDTYKGQGYKVDPRVTGRVFNYRIETEGYWRLAIIGITTQPVGAR